MDKFNAQFWLFLVFTSLVMFSSCSSNAKKNIPMSENPEVDFDNLCKMSLEDFSSMNESAFVAWAEETELSPLEESSSLSWKVYTWKDIADYYLQEDHLFNIVRTDLGEEFTLEYIVQEVGPPPKVLLLASTYNESYEYTIDLVYPTLGVAMLHSGSITTDEAKSPTGSSGIRLEGELQFTGVSCFAPKDTVREMLLADPRLAGWDIEELLSEYEIWPGIGGWIR